MACAIP